MKLGLAELFGNFRFFKGANYIGFQPPASITSSITFTLPGAFPAGTYMVVCDTSGVIGFQAISAGHTQNTDTGTTQTSFQIDSGNSGPRLKNSSGALQVRNSADSAYADLAAKDVTVTGNLTVQGTTTTIESNTLAIGDNVVVLNNDVTSGTPTEDGGIQIRRGASTSASLIWDETNDLWKAGLASSEIQLARIYRTTFQNSDLVSGVLTVTHNLGQQYPVVQLVDNNGKVIIPDDVNLSATNSLTVDLTSFGTLTGTWRVQVTG